MASSHILRRLRGALGNAVVWSAGWFVGAFALFAVLLVTGIAHGSLIGALRTAARFGVMGGIAGTAFSTFIGLRYHGYRLSKIGWLRFGIAGGVVTGLFVPGFIVLMRLLSGDAPLAFSALLRNGAVGLVFGGVAAASSLKLAQLANTLPRDRTPDQLDALEGVDRPDHQLPRGTRP